MNKPYIDEHDNIFIPHDCEDKYKWWEKENNDEMVDSFLETLRFLNRMDLFDDYVFRLF